MFFLDLWATLSAIFALSSLLISLMNAPLIKLDAYNYHIL